MTAGPGVRLVVHALDRTGPPVLVCTFARWLRANHPEVSLEVLAFRGGDLEADVAELGRLVVVLEADEPWDHHDLTHARAEQLRGRLAALGPAGVNLLVSTSAAQVLPLLAADVGPVVTWSVEIGEDLHWFDDPVDLVARTDQWLAGSETTARELAAHLQRAGVGDGPVRVVGEFVDHAAEAPPALVDAWRDAHGGREVRQVVGAGIGTYRKGVDLFVELAAAQRRNGGQPVAFTWIGGERDPVVPLARSLATDLGLEDVRFVPTVADLQVPLAAADVFVHVARTDAFPLVALHASLAGAPVVALSGTGGIQEMFGPTFCGAPYPDLVALASVVDQLADPDHRRAVAAAQHSWVSARHTTEVAAPELWAALEATAAGILP